MKITAVAPGAFSLAIEADGVQAVGSPGRDRCPPDEPRDVSDTRYFMACLDLRGRDCLVVGGGRVATEKVHGLLDCEARVTVVAPHVDDRASPSAGADRAEGVPSARTSTAACW